MLQPGNFVDVIVTIRPDDAEVQARWVTETILQGIRVLAVGETLSGAARTEEESSSRSNRRRQRPSVTLQLSLEEAEKLALASSKGDIHLVLRNDVDITQRDTHGPISTARMIGLGTESNQQSRTVTRQPDPSPQPITAEVIEGGTTIIESFDVDGNKINNRR